MLQKSLAAAAVIAAFTAAAGTAAAADVTLYGTVDTGFVSTHEKLTGEESDNRFELAAGFNTSSVFGLKGNEEIGDMTVSFVLENSFNSDDGSLSEENRLFDKEAQVSVAGRFGTLSMGRMGALTAGDGTYDIFMAGADSMDGGYGDYVGTGYWLDRGIYDNMVTYQSPEFGGFTAFAQYSFGTESNDAEHSRNKDRYAAVGATLSAGNFNAVLVVDTVLANRSFGDKAADYAKDRDDAMAVSFGMNYDFGFVKPYLAVGYFKDGSITDMGGVYDRDTEIILGEETGKANLGDAMSYMYFDGFAVAVGADAPLFGGTIHGMLGYLDADSDRDVTGSYDGDKIDFTRWIVGVGYDYNLSKRTVVYVDAGYMKDSWEFKGLGDAGLDNDPTMFQAALGMVHYF